MLLAFSSSSKIVRYCLLSQVLLGGTIVTQVPFLACSSEREIALLGLFPFGPKWTLTHPKAGLVFFLFCWATPRAAQSYSGSVLRNCYWYAGDRMGCQNRTWVCPGLATCQANALQVCYHSSPRAAYLVLCTCSSLKYGTGVLGTAERVLALHVADLVLFLASHMFPEHHPE